VINIVFVKKYHSMNGIKIIRDYFGLTQEELSVFLNVSSSMLRMAETNKRLLPTHALVKLSLLDAQLQQPKALVNNRAVVAHVKKNATQYAKQIQAQHKELQYKIALHKKKMNTMEKRYGQAVQALALATALKQKGSKMQDNKKDMAWLQLMEKKAGISLKNTQPVLQAHAQIKMDILLQEAAALQILLQKLHSSYLKV
jgi:transcriptional regulator with XRE-family HTH domain